MSTQTFTDRMWAQTADLRAAIDKLPFLLELEDGTLSRDAFTYYMRQDAIYLRDYARAMSTAAALAPTQEAQVFWAQAAAGAIEVEMELHRSHLPERAANDTAMKPSPTCTLYTSFLMAEATRGNYATLAAAVLPCFAVYDDVGRRLATRVRAAADNPEKALDVHPYGDWIATYEDEAFTESTRQACEFVDQAAAAASPATLARMEEAYVTTTKCEWIFWDAAHRRETWPV